MQAAGRFPEALIFQEFSAVFGLGDGLLLTALFRLCGYDPRILANPIICEAKLRGIARGGFRVS
jgi:hypothetical protein